MKKILQRGFTLIELLVVIAIIGILAAVVLASLNDARSSGSDASIKQSMGSIRSQAEIYYNNAGNFTYTDICADDAQITALIAAIDGQSPAATYCSATDAAWAASATMVSSSSAWCVDSTGFAGPTGAILTTGETCS